jgi:hypothetical protein
LWKNKIWEGMVDCWKEGRDDGWMAARKGRDDGWMVERKEEMMVGWSGVRKSWFLDAWESGWMVGSQKEMMVGWLRWRNR